ncbi:hypothetical protein [Lactococcus hircilactis]|nr:hypothetical protein [Lactococcus hircilactis]
MGSIFVLFYELMLLAIVLAGLYFVVKLAIKHAIKELKDEHVL